MTITVLISGRGSNMVAIHQACQRGDLSSNISHVISNEPDAPGLVYAQENGIETSVIDHRQYSERHDFDDQLLTLIENNHPTLVLLAGFMRRLGADFTHALRGRLLNIHPSLLPRHRGLKTHEKALSAQDRWHGCSVHFVSAELDGGPLIARSAVPVESDDTADSLAQRVLSKEHELYWRATQMVLEGRIKWRDGHTDYCGNRLVYPLTLRQLRRRTQRSLSNH